MDAHLALFIYVSVAAIHRSVANLPGVTPLKQIDSSLPPPQASSVIHSCQLGS